MRGRRLRRLVPAVVVAALAATLTAGWFVWRRTGARLGPSDSETTTTIPGRVGERMDAFEGGFEPHGHGTIHVRAVRLTGFPEGLRLVGVYGLEGGPPAGYRHGLLPSDVVARLRPVTDMAFRVGAPHEEWGLVIVIEGTKPGVWRTTGIDVDWRAGWHEGTAHYAYRVGMDVTP